LPADRDIASLISNLSDEKTEIRERAAAALFGRGREMALAAIKGWLADAELKECMVRGEDGFPEMTAGIAVVPDAFEKIRAANGMPRLASVPPDQDAKEFELEFKGGVRLDVLTTRDEGASGAIARFLRRHGAGIQQVELLVRSVDRSTQILRERFGVTAVYPATRAGADDTRVNFFLVPADDGKKVLIELVEEP
jgi:hypothetical protein